MSQPQRSDPSNLIRITPAKGQDRGLRLPLPVSKPEAVMLSHKFSDRPIAATIAVVVRNDEVLLVRRANPPDAGKWGFPGGKIARGERLEEAAVRELREETGVVAETVRILTAVDALNYGSDNALLQHFILIAVLCRWISGEPVAGDDALEASWFELDKLAEADLALSLDVLEVAAEGAALMAENSP